MKSPSPKLLKNAFSVGHACRSGFSLVELLAVTALFALVASLVTPAVSSILAGNRVAGAASGLALVFEQARAYAMAQNTPVYVGFAEVDPSDRGTASPGTGKVVVAAFALKGGGTSFTNGSELVPIGQLRQFSGVTMDGGIPSSGSLTREPADLGISPSTFPELPDGLQVGPWRFVNAVRFDPQGSAWASSDTTPPGLLELGLRPARDTTPDRSNPNVAALQIDGLTGAVRLYRP